MNEMIGKEYRDKVTNFEGICTGFCEYISGCNQALLQPKVDKDQKYQEGRWIDVQRLEEKFPGGTPLRLQNEKTPGPDMPAPVR